MKYDFKGITTEELSYKLNRINIAPNQRLDIKPQFSRQVRKSNDNPKLCFIALSVKIESTEQEPKPFNINVSIVGVFELEKLIPAGGVTEGTSRGFSPRKAMRLLMKSVPS